MPRARCRATRCQSASSFFPVKPSVRTLAGTGVAHMVVSGPVALLSDVEGNR